mmetsp:Transcript_53468/g.120081  ORF Transcript_53468/g.120081 Transcript_53468/m.120081 type:complete len:218 (-) Transcript_53468:33-686(-)
MSAPPTTDAATVAAFPKARFFGSDSLRIVPMKRFLEVPMRSGNGWSCSTMSLQLRKRSRLCSKSLAKPMPGSSMMFQDATPAASAAALRCCKYSVTSVVTPRLYVVKDFIVAGVPRMCMRIKGAIVSAATPNMAASNSAPETSLIQSAPASTAALATAALRVSTLMVATIPSSRIAWTRGTTRFSSSSTDTSSAPGLVDSPPISSMSAPAATMAFAD